MKRSLTFLFLGVGKSCLLLKYTKDKYNSDHEQTIGVDFGTKRINIQDKEIKLQLWDTVSKK